MADKPLTRYWFPLVVNRPGDAGAVNNDFESYFSCRANVFRFLDIPNEKVAKGAPMRKRKGYSRSNTLADGTILGYSTENSDKEVKESLVPIRRVVGKKRVILVTGRRTKQVDVGQSPANYNTLSFAFPNVATGQIIAEALAEIIPSNKIAAAPSATQIFPLWKFPKGGSYPILSQAAASSSTVTDTTNNAFKAKIEGNGGDVPDANTNP